MPFFLDPAAGALQPDTITAEGSVTYDSAGRAIFSLRFDKETELTGEMKLRLWVSTSAGDDLDLFVLKVGEDSARCVD